MKAIEAKGLVRKFGDLAAVDNVSFEVEQGEIFGFLGPNGAGKTTTINMLCTLLRPTAGTATVNGYDVAQQPDDVRQSIGLVFQDPSLDDKLTAMENLRFHALLYDVPRDVFKRRAREVLELAELTDRADSLVQTFSGGMKRRLEIARGLLHHPRVLFLDELLAGDLESDAFGEDTRMRPPGRPPVWHVFKRAGWDAAWDFFTAIPVAIAQRLAWRVQRRRPVSHTRC